MGLVHLACEDAVQLNAQCKLSITKCQLSSFLSSKRCIQNHTRAYVMCNAAYLYNIDLHLVTMPNILQLAYIYLHDSFVTSLDL